ncbi:MAG: ABC transporter ATP-binding protein [Putridiphycobacter sp.]
MNLYSANQLNKQYSAGGFSLKNISFELKKGEITGVVGENGNGKTTLLRIVAGDLSFDEGMVSYFGQPAASEIVDWEGIKDRIAYIPQRIPKWYGHLRDNLIFEAAIRNIKGKAADSLVDQLVEKLGLQDYIHLKWKEISTGYRLRFQLAKILIGSPEILVLDEPIANLDINAQGKFLSDLRDIVKDENRNVSVILSSQQLHEIENVADNLIFLKKGSLIYSGEVEMIGQERKENEFEISGNFSESFLLEIFKDISIEKSGKTYTITAPLELNSEAFLKAILNEHKSITYFRDISSSSKKLFNN